MPRLFSVLLVFVLALPAFGQREKLIGTWEYQPGPEDQESGTVLHLEFKDGDQFEVTAQSILSGEQLFQELGRDQTAGAGKLLRTLGSAQADSSALVPEFPGVEIGDEVLAEILVAILPDTLTTSVTVTGIWEADEQLLRLDGQTSQIRVNGLEPREFLDQLARRLAGELASKLEISAEDYPEFEATIVQGFSDGAEGKLEGEFNPDEVDVEGTYVIQDGLLTVTDKEGGVTRFQRVLASAVEALSWGQFKAASH